MTAYYCDLGEGTFADRDGTDSGANVLTGPAGVQAIIRATGNAVAGGAGLTAGDTLYYKGIADLTRYVRIICDKDVSALPLGEAVRNDTGDGDDWTGVIVQRDVLGANTDLLVWLASGKDNGDINAGDGIEQSDEGDSAGIVNSTTDFIRIDTNSGTETARMRFMGCKSDYTITDVEDPGNTEDYQATFDGGVGNDAALCLFVANSVDYVDIFNTTLRRASSNLFDGTASHLYFRFRHCTF